MPLIPSLFFFAQFYSRSQTHLFYFFRAAVNLPILAPLWIYLLRYWDSIPIPSFLFLCLILVLLLIYCSHYWDSVTGFPLCIFSPIFESFINLLHFLAGFKAPNSLSFLRLILVPLSIYCLHYWDSMTLLPSLFVFLRPHLVHSSIYRIRYRDLMALLHPLFLLYFT